MKKTFLIRLITVAMAVLLTSTTAVAQMRPLDFFRNIGRTVEADPNKEYLLTETEGPFLIFVAAFSGPTARQDAHSLVLELRRTHRWHAYMYEKTFERDINRDFRQLRSPSSRTTLRYQNSNAQTEFAVLVGNFPSLEDRQYERTLAEVNQKLPELLQARPSATRFAIAFGLANPFLPSEAQRGFVDPLIESINKNRPFSLLRNPRRYTVQIATFTGHATYEGDRVRSVGGVDRTAVFGQKMSELEMGEQATVRLTRALRERGIEAYEFHDRNASFVTVGSFDHHSRRMPDGTVVLDPQIQHIKQQFQGRVEGTSYIPVIIDGIECDMLPRVIEVPRVRRSP